MQSYIEVEDVKKIYIQGGNIVSALAGVSFNVNQGEFLTIMGPSGSGKSTLGHLLGTMDTPTSGRIRVGEQQLGESPAKLSKWRAANIGFVFQQAFLMPGLTAVENIQVPLLNCKMSSAQRKKRALLALDLVGLSSLKDHKPSEMSGGQEQRCAFARAIITDPKLIICDEPTGALDRENADMVLNLLKLMSEEQQKTVIVVTHDHKIADFSHRTINIENGLISRDHKRA